MILIKAVAERVYKISHDSPCRKRLMPDGSSTTHLYRPKLISMIAEGYSLDLALRLKAQHGSAALAGTLVPNEVAFGPEAAIFILTGPNSGGRS